VPVDDSADAGAPDEEIEITPEMIRRGIAALESEMVGGEIGVSDQFKRDAVVHIFRAMIF
jgi:hypothetical protein